MNPHHDPLHSRFVARVAPRLSTELKAAEAVVASILSAEVVSNDTKRTPAVDDMTAFHALEAPAIHVRDYVHRLASYSFSSTACLIAALHYVKRAVAKDPRLAPTSLSVHRLLITGLVLAAKFFDDVTYSMSYYAKVGGLPVKELAYLELKLLALLDFRLHIPTHSFHTLERDLVDALSFVPRVPIVNEATKLIRSCGIDLRPDVYCEALHHDDTFGLWLQHPTPSAHMLASLQSVGSPCSTPPRAHSPRHAGYASGQYGAYESDPFYSAGSGKLERFSSNSSTVTVEGGYEPRQYAIVDEGSAPLVRYSSNCSTVTSEGSACTETSMCSVGATTFDDTPKWPSIDRNVARTTHRSVQPPHVISRLPYPPRPTAHTVSREQWETGEPPFDAEVRAALSN